MSTKVHYGTVTEAINTLRSKGFTLDFNLQENCIVCNTTKYDVDEFDIVDVYRYEGNSDPADEAAVYAIESRKGEKGILVTGYGLSTDEMSSELLQKLSQHPGTSEMN
ncbi:MAG TPA: hypothetical protein VLC28_14040 [Flavitalea sp.]|nr:hypothetical protein [Flavitalea sp.]